MTTTDFTIEADELRNSEYSFRLSPVLWDNYRGPSDLEWGCVPFDDGNLQLIPEGPGVYALCVRPSVGGNLCGSYLLYVGKTCRSLRTRYREYLAHAKAGRERPKVQRMLHLFFGSNYLHFCFAIVTGDDPASIEDSLAEATVPPACTTFPASIRSAVAAF